MLGNVDFALQKAEEKGIRIRTDSYMDSDLKLQELYCNQRLNLNKLSSLNKLLKDATNDMLRQAAFKEEAIYKGMLIEDYLNSKKAFDLGS